MDERKDGRNDWMNIEKIKNNRIHDWTTEKMNMGEWLSERINVWKNE